jgi:hypothetical protein
LFAHVKPTLNRIIPIENRMYPTQSRALSFCCKLRDTSSGRLGGLKRKKIAIKLIAKSPAPMYQTTRKPSALFFTRAKPMSSVNIPPRELEILTPAWASGRYRLGRISDATVYSNEDDPDPTPTSRAPTMAMVIEVALLIRIDPTKQRVVQMRIGSLRPQKSDACAIGAAVNVMQMIRPWGIQMYLSCPPTTAAMFLGN